ncbi:hypothetical protein [Pontibacter pamirensis]|uniref:hypothetical protein n=1 Tax=Pontibacter pamirensis TaxID=2562824 RepID=UPI001389BD07|nr:hypothetical protein [Pontibacter pamirensis]
MQGNYVEGIELMDSTISTDKLMRPSLRIRVLESVNGSLQQCIASRGTSEHISRFYWEYGCK